MKTEIRHHDIYELALKQLSTQGFRVDALTNNPDKTITLTGVRLARRSGIDGNVEPYQCDNEWPIEIFCQCGDDGIVLGNGKKTVAFFEAFPKEPNTFIRGEGKSVASAEHNCWLQFQKILKCPKHEYLRGKFRDGHGTCKHCGLWFRFADPEKPCQGCKSQAYELGHIDQHDQFWCRPCFAKEGGSKIISPKFR